ncbi:MAG: hypothetical protein KAX23_03730 [Dehalococcoidia bacterium]|jgi:hypothetical protein|nr:hypothetical protein [Chloroflexota bacterium]MCK4242641.1 hypothetical protein [Dehalococcoidia bacterium]
MPVRLFGLEGGVGLESVEARTSIELIGETPVRGEIGETLAHATYISEEFRSFVPPVLRLEEPTFEDQPQLCRVPQNGKSRTIEISVPELGGLTKADPILTNRVRRLLTVLWAIVVSRALQVGFPLVMTTVSTFEDPTEQERKAVLRLTCNASAVQAIAFWDSLEPDLQDWLATLSEADRATFITKLSLRVHWH